MAISDKLKARIAKNMERNNRISQGFPHAIKVTQDENKVNKKMAIVK